MVAALMVVGGTTFCVLPQARASTATMALSPSVEAWYEPDPTCSTPLGCVSTEGLPTVAGPSPYPAGTMHVATRAGQEAARSYLSFIVPPLADLRGAVLEVPLSEDPADGSVAPSSSQVLVCPFEGTIVPVEGSRATPPTALCATNARAVYVPGPRPHLHADLGSLREQLERGAGLALVPDPAGPSAATDAWHVVFSSHGRTNAGSTPAAVLRLLVASDENVGQSPTPAAVPHIGTTTAPPLRPEGMSAPEVNTPAAPIAQPGTPGTTTTARTRAASVGYAYPVVWLLPLAFVTLVPATARALTRDLAPGPRRTPA